MKLFGKKHRVLEVFKGDNTSLFYPQEKQLKFLFIPLWQTICSDHRRKDKIVFRTIEKANQFLHEKEMEEISKKVIKKKSHPFNLVHYKLSQK